MMKKSPSKPTLSTPTKSKKSTNKDREKKKLNLLGEPSGSSCNTEKVLVCIRKYIMYVYMGNKDV